MRFPAPLLAGLPLLGAFAIAGCGGVDSSKLQEEIQKDIEATGAKVTSVTCPDDQELKKGTSFNCTATAAGKEVPVKVTITSEDDGGRAEYEIPQQLLVPPQ